LPPREKKARTLNLLRKELVVLMKKFWCSSGMAIRASAASALTMVAWLVHPHLTHLRLIPLLRPKLMMMMMKKMKKVEKRKMMMMSEVFKKPSPTFFGCWTTKGGGEK
jgi:hypothetical protein